MKQSENSEWRGAKLLCFIFIKDETYFHKENVKNNIKSAMQSTFLTLSFPYLDFY